MDAVLVGADRLGNIPDVLAEFGLKIGHHITGREPKHQRSAPRLPGGTQLVILFTDFLGHNVMKAFREMGGAAHSEGALDPKTKELLAIGIAIATRCDGCIGFHVKAAIRAGASREEVLETISMAIYMGAGPSMIYASEALRAFDELAPPADAGA